MATRRCFAKLLGRSSRRWREWSAVGWLAQQAQRPGACPRRCGRRRDTDRGCSCRTSSRRLQVSLSGTLSIASLANRPKLPPVTCAIASKRSVGCAVTRFTAPALLLRPKACPVARAALRRAPGRTAAADGGCGERDVVAVERVMTAESTPGCRLKVPTPRMFANSTPIGWKRTPGNSPSEVGGLADAAIAQRVVGDGGDRDRHLLQVLLDLLRRDDDFLEPALGSLRSCAKAALPPEPRPRTAAMQPSLRLRHSALRPPSPYDALPSSIPSEPQGRKQRSRACGNPQVMA